MTDQPNKDIPDDPIKAFEYGREVGTFHAIQELVDAQGHSTDCDCKPCEILGALKTGRQTPWLIQQLDLHQDWLRGYRNIPGQAGASDADTEDIA